MFSQSHMTVTDFVINRFMLCVAFNLNYCMLPVNAIYPTGYTMKSSISAVGDTANFMKLV